MRSVEFVIEGKTPLLINRFHEEARAEATSGVHARTRDRLSPAEDAASRLYEHGGTPYFPAENLRQAVITGSGRFKIGRRAASSDMAAALLIQPEELGLSGEWEVDERPIVNPATKGRMLRYRPVFPKWTVSGVLSFDEQLVSATLVRDSVDAAGNYVGIGDFRPQKKGPYGRFAVITWAAG